MFFMSDQLRYWTHDHYSFEVLIEPLLVCMIVGFLISSYSDYRGDFSRVLNLIGPAIYVLFFTLTGASLALDILLETWPIALALFFVRLIGIAIGSFGGGTAAGDPAKHNRVAWMAFVTQAGVGLGLAKEVAVEFPEWGDGFATIIIAVIVLNQIVGPPLFKWVINLVGESHLPEKSGEFDGTMDALIFGLHPEAITLARQLMMQNWQVKVVCANPTKINMFDAADLNVVHLKSMGVEQFKLVDWAHADAVISFLPNHLSYEICEYASVKFGIETIVVRLEDCDDADRFRELGVRVVEPQTAIINLLEHFVRAPAGTGLLMGREPDLDMIDQVVRNPNIHGMMVRELHLPLDVLILSIKRDGYLLMSRGFTRIQPGDKVTLVGPREKLQAVRLRFSA